MTKITNTRSHLILYLLFIATAVYTQSPCFPTGITFSTQLSINNFANNYPNCTKIGGGITITSSNINKLDGLWPITEIGGDLTIEFTEIESLDGLQNLSKIGGDFIMIFNQELCEIDDLNSLDSVYSINIDYHDKLEDIYVLNNIEYLKELSIIDNLNITNIGTFDNLDSLNKLAIWELDQLTSFDAFPNLEVCKRIDLSWNNLLEDISFISDLYADSINCLIIRYNPMLVDCHFENICDFLSNPIEYKNGATADRYIFSNGNGCSNIQSLMDSCCINGYHNEILNTWLNEDSDWHNEDNWNLGAIPNECQHALIPNNSTVLINNGTPATCEYITIEAEVDFTCPNATNLIIGN